MIHCAIVAVAQLMPPALELDFSPATTGQSYRIALVVTDAAGKVLVSGPIDIGKSAGTEDIRDAIGATLGDSGLEIKPTRVNKLRLASKGNVKLGSVAYATWVRMGEGFVAAPDFAGPTLLSRTGGASLTVNGAPMTPEPPKRKE